MSGIVKAVKKVFKKVVDVAKKVAPIVLAGAAILFTAGAALGIAGLAGGWGAAAGALSSSMGLTGTLGSVVTGAITHAGYGAALGLVTGGKEGAKMGALAGALTGGVSGAIGGGATAAARATQQAGGGIGATAAPADAVKAWTGIGPGTSAATRGLMPGGGELFGGDILGEGGWLERNQGIVGSLVSGVGKGLLAKSEADAQAESDREYQRWVAGNYGEGRRGLLTPQSMDYAGEQPPRPTPAQQFEPSYEYVYDPQAGQIVRKPIA